MSIYRAILNILTADSDFSAAIGSDSGTIKVYTIFPQRTISKPWAAMKIVNQVGNPTKSTGSDVDNVSFSIRIFNNDMDDVIDTAEKCRTALEGKSGTFDTVAIGDIEFESFNDDFLFFEGEQPLLYRELNFEIWVTP